jgi:hypothetical protein
MNKPLQLAVLITFLPALLPAQAQNTPTTTTGDGFFTRLFSPTARAEAKVTAKSAYEPAARDLALLCQSDPFFFLDEPPFAPAWTPSEILKLGPTWVQIDANSAHVEFGGGFHHFGYDLKRDPSADTAMLNGWVLSFYSEDNPTRQLMNFTLKKADHVDRQQFVARALADYENRTAGQDVRSPLVSDRIVFLLKFDEVEKARISIRKCAAANPHDWMDQLLAYLIDIHTDPRGAGQRLDAWAGKINDFTAWIFAAYVYGIAGDEDGLEQCVKTALKLGVDEPIWTENNARFRATTICIQLLKARRYETCAALCEALSAYWDGGDFLLPQLTAIDKLAKAKHGADAPPILPEGTVFEPFKGIELTRLALAKPATQPATVASRDRMLDYYDHRIAADPASQDNYAVKIAYLLKNHREADALATCRKASEVFPNWWRPRMALVLLSNDEDRSKLEPQFRKWIEAHPSFIHWWYLSRYLKDTGRDIDAVAALANAVKYPLESVDQDEMWVPAAFAFDAASYALRQKQFNLVLDIARVWSKPKGIYNYFSDDIYAFRAAAELSLGQFAAAKDDADKVVKAAAHHAIWAENLKELKQAADAQDQHFIYHPGNSCGGDWSLFPEQ